MRAWSGKAKGISHESGAVQSSLENATGDDVTSDDVTSDDDEVNEDVCASSISQPKKTKAKADGRINLIKFTKDQRNGKLIKKLPSDQVSGVASQSSTSGELPKCRLPAYSVARGRGLLKKLSEQICINEDKKLLFDCYILLLIVTRPLLPMFLTANMLTCPAKKT